MDLKIPQLCLRVQVLLDFHSVWMEEGDFLLPSQLSLREAGLHFLGV